MRDVDRQRHQGGGVPAGVAEHQALIAGALLVERIDVRGVLADLFGVVDTLRDVGRLRAERHQHAAGTAVEARLSPVVADVEDPLASDCRDIRVGGSRDLTGDHHGAGGHQGLDRHSAVRIIGQQGVEDCVGNRIRDLVGVPLRDGFGREQATHSELLIKWPDRSRTWHPTSEYATPHCKAP